MLTYAVLDLKLHNMHPPKALVASRATDKGETKYGSKAVGATMADRTVTAASRK